MDEDSALVVSIETNRIAKYSLIPIYGKLPHDPGVSRLVERRDYPEVLVEVGFGKSRFDDCSSRTLFEIVAKLLRRALSQSQLVQRAVGQSNEDDGDECSNELHVSCGANGLIWMTLAVQGPNRLRYSCEVTKPVTIPRGSLVASSTWIHCR